MTHPTPEDLLERIRQHERARLRVYIGAAPGVGEARVFAPMPGGAAVVSVEDDILYLDTRGETRMMATAPGAEGLIPTGDGTWIVLQATATTVLLPE